jgi:hypothetical protein
MKVMNWPRMSGKTTAVIEWWAEDPLNRQIVVPTAQRKDQILGLLVDRYQDTFTTDFLRKAILNAGGAGVLLPAGITTNRNKTLAIDELDAVLYTVFGRQVEIVTLTAERVAPPAGEEQTWKPC